MALQYPQLVSPIAPRGLVPNASPLVPADFRGQGGVTLMPMPQAPQAPQNAMSQLGGPGGIAGMMALKGLMNRNTADQNMALGGKVAGLLSPDITQTIGRQIGLAGMNQSPFPEDPSAMGPSITGEMVPGGGAGFMNWLKNSPLMGWFGNFGG